MEPHNALHVANAFIRRAIDGGKPLTALQVIRLTYFAQAWMLGLYSRPLFEQEIEAWRYGPVVADVYYAVKHYKLDAIREPIPGVQGRDFDDVETDLLDQVYRIHGKLGGAELSALAREPGSPWDEFDSRGGRKVIPTSRIKLFYAKVALTTKVA